jgi:uncharacterized membrane protein
MSETPSVPPTYTPPPPPGGGSYTPPPPPPPGGGPAPGGDRTLMLVLSYLGILALIPLLTKKEDREIQWHAKNGLALAIAWVAVWIVWTIISIVLAKVIGPLACGANLVGCIIGIAFFVVDIMAMIKAINGQRMRVPVVSDLADKM